MESAIRNLLKRELERVLDLVTNDKCEMTASEAMAVIGLLSHEAMSKEQVLVYLGWSRAKFDDCCHRGLMPQGRKRSGWKELCWYKDEINDALIVMKNKNYN